MQMLEKLLDRGHLERGEKHPYPATGKGYQCVQQVSGHAALPALLHPAKPDAIHLQTVQHRLSCCSRTPLSGSCRLYCSWMAQAFSRASLETVLCFSLQSRWRRALCH